MKLKRHKDHRTINKAPLKKDHINEIKVLLIKCIDGITVNNSVVPDLATHNISQKLADLFNFTNDLVTKKISIELIIKICEHSADSSIVEFVYRNMDIETVIQNMNIGKDVEMARSAFQLMSLFCTQNKVGLKSSIFSQIPRMRKYIFECLSDQEISPECKTE